MNQIFSADKEWGIGYNNQLLFYTKGDMAHFRKHTVGNVIIMGRKTLASLPGQKPLPNRTNIVLTRDPHFSVPDVVVCRDLDALFAALAPYPDEKIFVIGGSEIYRQLLPYSSYAYVTQWDTVARADAFVPHLDMHPDWQCIEKSERQTEGSIAYHFCVYQNQCVQKWRP